MNTKNNNPHNILSNSDLNEIMDAVSQLKNIHNDAKKLLADKVSFDSSIVLFTPNDLEKISANESIKKIKSEYDAAMSIIDVDEFNKICLRINVLRGKTEKLIELISRADDIIIALETVLQESLNVEV